MTQESIEGRISQLQEQKQSLIADLNAVDGAIQDCQYWLKQLEADNDAIEQEDGTPGKGEASSDRTKTQADKAQADKAQGRRHRPDAA